ncbi:hypothetical protein [Aquimarina brevivitae]|uniref:Uncharacterized protein n=1 Tax=Aquimarina brevivitae TaxID=323412 RepID=A0A4Q7P0M9_9FLAO|nr:hypothetical protein [Aquimarina brevivitae]RZS93351.1 hypothetical protein EV197_1929 [Aquimarina brevivitae]
MDELELLKKDWKRREGSLPKLSYDEIYKMILKKSSSIVKWIFIVSILEFVLWTSLDLILRFLGVYDPTEGTYLEVFTYISYFFSYGILFYFMVKFYLNYKRIKVTDSAKELMHNIIKTRKTVKHYVFINLSFLAIFSFISVFLVYYSDSVDPAAEELPLPVLIITSIILISIFIGLIALLYRVVYGVLTRRLKRNYEELESLDE